MSTVKLLGQYPTPVWAAEALVERHFSDLTPDDFFVEPSCGPGAFLCAMSTNIPGIGVEIDPVVATQARINSGRIVINQDFMRAELDTQPTVVIGNPPFNMKTIDQFLDRSHDILADDGRVGFILPCYAFQTASRVARYAKQWSLFQEMIPRNIYPGLSLPLLFAIFTKDRKNSMVGFALYRQAADVQNLPSSYRNILTSVQGSVWRAVVKAALTKLGGAADLGSIYKEVEGSRPTETKFWREQIRKVLRTHPKHFQSIDSGRYSLIPQ